MISCCIVVVYQHAFYIVARNTLLLYQNTIIIMHVPQLHVTNVSNTLPLTNCVSLRTYVSARNKECVLDDSIQKLLQAHHAAHRWAKLKSNLHIPLRCYHTKNYASMEKHSGLSYHDARRRGTSGLHFRRCNWTTVSRKGTFSSECYFRS